MIPNDVRQVAEAMAAARSIPPAHLLAIIEVESGGRVFAMMGGKPFPLILFEPHLIYRLTSGEIRARLLAEKLASKRWNKKLYPKTQPARWQQVRRAAEIAGPVAYEAVSYGIGQVLGQHWQALGFASLQAFLDKMFAGAEGQIEIMLRYIETNGLVDELQAGQWPAFFRGYNGPQWKKNGYGEKIKEALAEFGGATARPDGMLRMGARGARVRELQALLVRAGYPVKVDGDFGLSTKQALQAFQTANGIKPDGVAGPVTEGKLNDYRQGAADKPGAQAPNEVKEVVEGGAAAGGAIAIEQAKDAVDNATTQLQQVDGLSPWIGYGLTALSVVAATLAVAGIAWAVWGWVKSKRTVEV
jgi:hypothetical protein